MYAYRQTEVSRIERAIDSATSYLELRDVALRIHGVRNPAEVRRLRERVLEVAFARFSVGTQRAEASHV